MDMKKLETAISEAERFLVRARAIELVTYESHIGGKPKTVTEVPYGDKNVAACKRASLDLTRALAQLRK